MQSKEETSVWVSWNISWLWNTRKGLKTCQRGAPHTTEEFRDNYMGGKVRAPHERHNTLSSSVLQDGLVVVPCFADYSPKPPRHPLLTAGDQKQPLSWEATAWSTLTSSLPTAAWHKTPCRPAACAPSPRPLARYSSLKSAVLWLEDYISSA